MKKLINIYYNKSYKMKLNDTFEGEISFIFVDGINKKSLFQGIADVLLRYKKMIIYDERGEFIYRCEYCDLNDWYNIIEIWNNNYWKEKSQKEYSDKIKVIGINNYICNSFGNYGNIDFSVYNDELFNK